MRVVMQYLLVPVATTHIFVGFLEGIIDHIIAIFVRRLSNMVKSTREMRNWVTGKHQKLHYWTPDCSDGCVIVMNGLPTTVREARRIQETVERLGDRIREDEGY